MDSPSQGLPSSHPLFGKLPSRPLARLVGLGSQIGKQIIPMTVVVTLNLTWTPKVCNIMAIMAVIIGLRLLFYIPLVDPKP